MKKKVSNRKKGTYEKKKEREKGSIRTSETPRLRQYPLNLAERREKSFNYIE